MRARDVVIVGAGPAGAVSALLLARAGFDVELTDRAQFPRAKACGECISPGANAVLQHLGLWQAVLALQPALLQGWQLSCATDATFSSRFAGIADEPMRASIAIDRERFDLLLLEAAQAAGAHVRTGCRIRQLLRDGDGTVRGVIGVVADAPIAIPARLTIGADGLRSRVARLLHAYRRAPRVQKLSLTTHVRGLPDARELGAMHVRGDACLGIAAIEASADPLFNVTVVLRSRAAPHLGPHELLRRSLREFGRPDIAERITDDARVLASGPFDWPVRTSVQDGVLLVGDAAGYFDPFTGQGIYQALAGAELVARHAGAALQRGQTSAAALSSYARAQHALSAPPRRVQHVVDWVCARPQLARTMFRSFARAPELADALIAVTGDMRPARALLAPRLMTRLLGTSLAAAFS